LCLRFDLLNVTRQGSRGILESGRGINRLAAIPGLGRPILAAASPAIRYTLTVECAADYVVTDTRQVFDTTASNQHHRVLLKVMAFTTDVGGDFYPIGQSDPGDLPESRVRFLWSHGAHLDADTPPLRAIAPNCARGLPMPTVNQLVRKGRKPVRKKTKAPAMHWVQNSL
jgi:hypothetical protein